MPTIHRAHPSLAGRTACGIIIDDPLFVVVGPVPTCGRCQTLTREPALGSYRNPDRLRVTEEEWQRIWPDFVSLVDRLTVSGLATEIGVGHGRVSDWWQGKYRPSRPYFDKLVAKIIAWGEFIERL